MFGFLADVGNYDERKVANFTDGSLQVDTVAVSDSDQPYETAVMHPRYNDGKWVIVQMYETKDDASFGHDAWVAIMTADELPESLKDVSTSDIKQLLNVLKDEDC